VQYGPASRPAHSSLPPVGSASDPIYQAGINAIGQLAAAELPSPHFTLGAVLSPLRGWKAGDPLGALGEVGRVASGWGFSLYCALKYLVNRIAALRAL
jgi:hypothetical protein